jgi:hypothetical protein
MYPAIKLYTSASLAANSAFNFWIVASCIRSRSTRSDITTLLRLQKVQDPTPAEITSKIPCGPGDRGSLTGNSRQSCSKFCN